MTGTIVTTIRLGFCGIFTAKKLMRLKSDQTLPTVHHLPSACHSAIPGNLYFQPDVSGLSIALRTGERTCRGGDAADYARAINISSNNPIA